jgi:hypothetical protein
MKKRMIILGLAALCALGLTAISASPAFAGATAFACIEGAGEHNTNADCQPGSSGSAGHLAIGPNVTAALKFNKLTNPILIGKLFGAEVELTATGFECIGCLAENKEVAGVMEVVSVGGKLTLTGVKVVGLESKCEVVGTKSEDITTKEVKFTTTVATGVTLEPVAGTTLAEFNIVSKPSQTCVVAGSLQVTGKGTASLSGAKLTISITKASGELLLNSEKASLKAEATVEADAGFHPVSLTTS